MRETIKKILREQRNPKKEKFLKHVKNELLTKTRVEPEAGSHIRPSFEGFYIFSPLTGGGSNYYHDFGDFMFYGKSDFFQGVMRLYGIDIDDAYDMWWDYNDFIELEVNSMTVSDEWMDED